MAKPAVPPPGYRWATAEEVEAGVQGVMVPLTVDCNGVPYTQDEADLAVPIGMHPISECAQRGRSR